MSSIVISINTKQTNLPPPTTSTSPGVVGYMLKEDKDVFGGIRSCASCPAVFTLKDDPHAGLGQQWQYYLIAINYAMDLDDVYLVLDTHLAFANGTGFRNDSEPRADYFHNKDLKYPAPNLDKVRSCSRNVVTGVEQYNLRLALKNAPQAFLGASGRPVAQVLTSKNVLKVQTFDSTKPPPLKQGRTYPQSISEIDPTDYLYTPQYNREMFVVANIVNKSGEVSQFPRGGLYNWTDDNTPYTFLPLISNHTYGDVLYPLDYLTEVGNVLPKVYRSN